jgi:C1A family cysteine protease
MTENKISYAFGWVHEYPDFRDYSPQHEKIVPILTNLNMVEVAGTELPTKIDLSPWCSPVEEQKELGSCTANAGVGMIEYFERRKSGEHIDASRLFLYKTTRKLLEWSGDTGAYIRTTMGAMVLFGLPPEKFWPYTDKPGKGPDGFDREPPAFLYALGASYKTILYYKLDLPEHPKAQVLDSIKMHLAGNFPSMFGFTVYTSLGQAKDTGMIPYPSPKEKVLGGHAVMAVGYDDGIRIENSEDGSSTTGALLIRNSWGEAWGKKGYGWLPYEYVLKGLAVDWWTIIDQSYVKTCQFGF